MSQETFSETLIPLEAFKRIFVLRPKIDFFQGVGPWFWVENDQMFKSAFFTPICPHGSRCVVKPPWESFLSANNALTKNF